MALAGTIEIDMIANIARLTDSMNQAVGTVGNSMKSIERSIESAKGVLASFGVGLSVIGLGRLVQDGLESADSMGKLAQKTGVSVESLSQMTVAAKLANVDMETMAKGMEQVSKSAALAASGTGTQAKAFEALGINTRNSAGDMKNADQLMREVSDAFAGLNDGAGKTAAAMAIFGRSGAELIPMLNKGSEELDNMAKLSDQLGLTLGGKTVEAATEVNDNFTKMALAAKGAGMQLLEQMLPTLENVSKSMLDAATNGGLLKDVIDALSVAAKVMVTGFEVVGSVLEGFGKGLGAAAAASVAFLHGNFSEASAIIKQNQEDAKASTEATVASITKLWEESGKAQEKAQQQDKTKKTLNLDLGTGVKKDAGLEEAQRVAGAYAVILDQRAAEEAELAKNQQIAYEYANKLDEQAANRKLQLQHSTYQQLYQMSLASELSISDIQQLSAQQRLGVAITGFQQLIGAAAQHSRAMFEIQKVLALAQAAIDLPRTVMAAFRVGTEIGGPILGAVYAAIATAAQLINISAIQSASFGGGGGSSASAGGTSGLPGQVANPNVVGTPAQVIPPPSVQVNINLGSDAGLLPASAVRDLIDQINDQIKDGATIGGITVS